MKDIIFVADLYANEILGGAELVNEELILLLESKGYNVSRLRLHKAQQLSVNVLKASKNTTYIFGSMTTLREDVKREIQSGGYQYIIYEHDHKYLNTRDPSPYKDYKAPAPQLVNEDFYNAASLVVCQSKLHEAAVKINLPEANTTNLGSSLWSDRFFQEVSKIEVNKTKNAAIVASDNQVKNVQQAIEYCENNNITYEIISAPTPLELTKKLADFEYLVFFPSVLESFCRVVVEAKMVGCKIITNHLLGASSEEWFRSNASDIIEEMRHAKKKTFRTLEPFLGGTKNSEQSHFKIIVPFYNAEKWISKCIKSIAQQKYQNYHCVLVDDASTDLSAQKAQEEIEGNPHFSLIKNVHNNLKDMILKYQGLN